MAKLMRAAQSYWAGNNFVAENKVMHEGDPDMIADYCEEFTLPESPAAPEEPKRGPGRPPKAQG